MRRFRLDRHVGFGSLAATFVLILLACSAPGSTEITIVYPSTSGLEVGNELRMSGYVVGTIEELVLLQDGQTGVQVRIQPKYTQHITGGVTFAVKRDGLLSKNRFIEMTPGDGTPSDETRFVGIPSWEDRLKTMTDQLLDSTGDAGFRQHLEALAEAAERAAEAGKEEWEARRPELESEAQRLLEQLEREGNEAAEQLRQEIEKYLKNLMEDEAEPGATEDERI